nr:IS30 family transposase [uncultured Roseobacter sp.]
MKWSPQQISEWLMRRPPEEEQEPVSHETIYRSLYAQTRGIPKTKLQRCLRSPRAIQGSRHATQKGSKPRKINDAAPNSERPPDIGKRAVPGHWKGDLIIGANTRYIGTLVERHSRFVMLEKIANNDTQSVITALIKQARRMRRSQSSICVPSERMPGFWDGCHPLSLRQNQPILLPQPNAKSSKVV